MADIYPESLNPDYFPPTTQLLHAETFSEAVENLAIRGDDFVLIATNNQDREALDKLIERPVAGLGCWPAAVKSRCFYARCGKTALPQNILPACMRRLAITLAPKRRMR